MFFIFAALTVIGVGGMVLTHTQDTANPPEVLPTAPTAGDDVTLSSLDQITTGLIYNPSPAIRERFVGSVDVLNASHVNSELGTEYARASLRNTANNFIIYMQRRRGTENIIVGFAVGALEMVQGTIYAKIDVLLAERGAGAATLGPLLRMNFENFRAAVSRAARRICFHLLSVPGQIDFYIRNGFSRVENYDTEDLAFMGLVVDAPAAIEN